MINFNENEIHISKGVYSLEQIWEEAVSQNQDHITKNEEQYIINTNVSIGVLGAEAGDDGLNLAGIEASNIDLTVLGTLFQIHTNAYAKFGEKTTSGTKNGCSISMPNVKLAYGFGNKEIQDDKTMSGSLYLYNSKVDIWGFWGFFGDDDQTIEIIDSLVNGYGRVAGRNTKLRNVTIQESHSRYGGFTVEGTIKEYTNVSSHYSDDASFYFNPNFSKNMQIQGGTFSGYQNLVYVEPNRDFEEDPSNIYTLSMLDVDIVENDNVLWHGDGARVTLDFTFDTVFRTNEGVPLSNTKIVIRDKSDEIVFDGNTDYQGRVNLDVTYKVMTPDASEVLTPHTIVVGEGDDETNLSIQIDKPFKDYEVFANNKTTTVINQETINNSINNTNETTINHISNLFSEFVTVVNGNNNRVITAIENKNCSGIPIIQSGLKKYKATFVSESAGYKNVFGVYQIDENNKPKDMVVLFKNSSAEGSGGDLIPGYSSVEFEIPATAEYGFFLIPNGANRFEDYDRTRDTIEWVDKDNLEANIDGSTVIVNRSYFTHDKEMNADNDVHIRTVLNNNGVTMGWEDLRGLGDRDFDDLVVRIEEV